MGSEIKAASPRKKKGSLKADLIKKMSLKEKISFLSGVDNWRTAAIPHLKIPSLVMTDGPHGVRAPKDENRQEGPATSFPTGVSMASSWDPDLIEEVGAALGEETRAMGCDILLGPCVNIMRSPLGGRNFESYSEDPFLAGRIAVAFINGVQSQKIGTSLKHFACNNQEYERHRGSSLVDERALREIYLPAFETAVKEAHPWTVMCSYNRINGVYASENRYLLTQILREEWGFEGVVVSDWGANHSTVESVSAGLDLEMPGPARYYGSLLMEAVYTWKIDAAIIDESVGRILAMLERSGKFPEPDQLPPASVNTPAHQELARRVAEQSIVLLKNEGRLLPLDRRTIKSIAILGPNASEARIGGGGSSFVVPPYGVSPLEGLKNKAGDSIQLYYDSTALQDIPQAVELARKADVALIFAGMPTGFETEGHDRPDMELPGNQNAYIEAVCKANPKTVVVLNCGSPVSMPWIDRAPALLEAFYPGQEGGQAVAAVLLGEVNPSGKLSVTLPRRYADNPAYLDYPGGREVHYGEGIFVGYRYYDYKEVDPLFPFGFGLSYTTFEYGDLQVEKSGDFDRPVKVSLSVKNTGGVEGKEVVQLYVADKQSSLPRPPKELKGFKKVSLLPGKRVEVSFTLDRRSFSFYDPERKAWVAEPGEFELLVGSSSRHIHSRANLVMS
jgi:beta-glucosidase